MKRSDQVVSEIVNALNSHRKTLSRSHVMILGVSDSRESARSRESVALDVLAVLHKSGTRVSYSDPFVPKISSSSWRGGYDLESTPLSYSTLGIVDCVAILIHHMTVDHYYLLRTAPLIVDTCNIIEGRHSHVFHVRCWDTESPALPFDVAAEDGDGLLG